MANSLPVIHLQGRRKDNRTRPSTVYGHIVSIRGAETVGIFFVFLKFDDDRRIHSYIKLPTSDLERVTTLPEIPSESVVARMG